MTAKRLRLSGGLCGTQTEGPERTVDGKQDTLLPRVIWSDWSVTEGTEYGPKAIYRLLYKHWSCKGPGSGDHTDPHVTEISATPAWDVVESW